MNIFVLDRDPRHAARMLCDQHVVKMLLESCQLLCFQFEPGIAPYKRSKSHYNHPVSVWTRESKDNYIWLIEHTRAIIREFQIRNQKLHKSQTVFEWVVDNYNSLKFPKTSLTDFRQCMPEEYQVPGDPVQAYRNYYIKDKVRFATWNRGVSAPYWWPK